MKIIVGLGNPDKKYQNTRHNVGFMTLDKLLENRQIKSADELEIIFKLNKKFEAKIADFRREGERIILVKPQTFMNTSGKAVNKIVQFYKAKNQDIWVITDDLDLPCGTIRVRLTGSSGGHKGLKSIIKSLGTQDFARIRLGIAEPQTQPSTAEKSDNIIDAESFVLSEFNKKEKALIEKSINIATEVIVEGIKNNILIAHTYN
jgi:PTH1 family peptidyl-tRNA hydrolase